MQIHENRVLAKGLFLIITANHYPTGDAGAVRLQAFADILAHLGYRPMVICMGETTHFQKRIFKEVQYISLRYPGQSFFSRGAGRLFYTWNLKYVFKRFPTERIRGILMDSGSRKTFAWMKQYAQKHSIPLYYDSVEWYSPSEFKNGEKNRVYRNNNALNTSVIDASYNVIAISRCLEENFRNRGVKTIRIPVFMDVKNISSEKPERDGALLKIVYAGSIGTKDHIQELIDAIERLNESERERIKFYVLGIAQEEYEQHGGKIYENLIERNVFFMGRVKRETVLNELNTADFSFLLRPTEERYARAGFPTKVVEGLATGTPILCNFSSDLDLYLKDGINSTIIEACSAEACLTALRKIMTYSNDDLTSMRVAARKTAEENFDWRLYVEPLEGFLSV